LNIRGALLYLALMPNAPFEQHAKLATDAVRGAYESGYQDGYRAAVAAVMRAAQAAAPSVSAEDGYARVMMEHADEHPFGIDAVATPAAAEAAMGIPQPTPNVIASALTPIPTTRSGRAAPGAIKNLVRLFVSTAGKPVTEAEFTAKYPNVLRPSRYMAFRGLRDEGVITKQGRSWVLTPDGARSPSAERAWDQLTREGGTGHVPA
jgi:hypothetical protein